MTRRRASFLTWEIVLINGPGSDLNSQPVVVEDLFSYVDSST